MSKRQESPSTLPPCKRSKKGIERLSTNLVYFPQAVSLADQLELVALAAQPLSIGEEVSKQQYDAALKSGHNLINDVCATVCSGEGEFPVVLRERFAFSHFKGRDGCLYMQSIQRGSEPLVLRRSTRDVRFSAVTQGTSPKDSTDVGVQASVTSVESTHPTGDRPSGGSELAPMMEEHRVHGDPPTNNDPATEDVLPTVLEEMTRRGFFDGVVASASLVTPRVALGDVESCNHPFLEGLIDLDVSITHNVCLTSVGDDGVAEVIITHAPPHWSWNLGAQLVYKNIYTDESKDAIDVIKSTQLGLHDVRRVPLMAVLRYGVASSSVHVRFEVVSAPLVADATIRCCVCSSAEPESAGDCGIGAYKVTLSMKTPGNRPTDMPLFEGHVCRWVLLSLQSVYVCRVYVDSLLLSTMPGHRKETVNALEVMRPMAAIANKITCK